VTCEGLLLTGKPERFCVIFDGRSGGLWKYDWRSASRSSKSSLAFMPMMDNPALKIVPEKCS